MSFKEETKKQLHLFEAVGVELEYMIVDRDTLDVLPVADKLIRDVAGEYVNEIGRGAISWSNELVLHLIELKTNGPAQSLDGLHLKFQEQVVEINRLLEPYNGMLMPGAMHPWMDSYREMKLWPHEYNPIYEAYNRIFDCRGHGWANLQSTHVNLPFSGDEEFEKLHAAIRVLLPILPAIAASSPIVDGAPAFFADYRMEVYRTNSKRIPSVTGYIVPEPAFSREDYDRKIFQRMYRDIAPHDRETILQEEWLNSRGAIARFDRGSIEIRVLDNQECPLADLAIVRFVVDTLKALVDEERFGSRELQKSWNEKSLYQILLYVMKDGEKAHIEGDYLRLFGMEGTKSVSAGELWKHIFSELYTDEEAIRSDVSLQAMQAILKSGTLSSRILEAVPEDFSRTDLAEVYNNLCRSLSKGEVYGVHE